MSIEIQPNNISINFDSGEKPCSPISASWEELCVEQQEGKGLQPLLAQGSASFDDPLSI